MRYSAAIIFLGIGLGAAALAASGEELVVTGERVNVRAGPSLDAGVVVQTGRGARALELGREGEWVEVRLDEQSVQGWIHQSLVAPAEVDAPIEGALEDAALPPLPDDAAQALERFRSSVDYLGWREGAADRELFADIRWLGPGAVQVEATAAWNELSPDKQAGYLETLFDRWLAAAGSIESLRVEIVGPSGDLLMARTGP